MLGLVAGRESAESLLARREPTYVVGRWAARTCPRPRTLIGQDHRGFYIPRPYTMELAHRRRTGLGRHGESPGEIVARLRDSGFTHLMLCPPVPETAVEFDPTLGRLLAPWLAGPGPVYREDLTDGDGVLRRYAIYELSDERLASAPREVPHDERDHADDEATDAPRDRPTLAELRARVQKGRHREIGNWLARRVARPTAVYGSWLAVRLGLSAHQVTAAAWLASLAAAVAIGTGDRSMFVVGVALAHLAFWLDHVDGQVARWRGTASLDGVYLDYLMHHAANLAMGFALGYGLASRSGDPRWTIAGFAIGGGWTLLEPAQRLPIQGVLPAAQGRDGTLPRRRRLRRSSPAAGTLAASRSRGVHLAGLQGVRAPRRLARVDCDGCAGIDAPLDLANPVARRRDRLRGTGTDARGCANHPLGAARGG